VPSLRILATPLGISHCGGQAMGSLLGYLVSSEHLRMFTLEEGDLLDKGFYLLASGG
jgi:hypothetical protein